MKFYKEKNYRSSTSLESATGTVGNEIETYNINNTDVDVLKQRGYSDVYTNTNEESVNIPTSSREGFNDIVVNNEGEIQYSSFASELQLLGISLLNDVDDPIGFIGQEIEFLFQLILDTSVFFIVAEAVLAINNSFGLDGEVIEIEEPKRNLRLGENYILDYDVFSRYLFKVLNYPKSKVSFLEKYSSFLVGIAEYLNSENTFDLNKLIKNLESNVLDNDNSSVISLLNFNSLINISNPLISLVYALSSVVIGNLLNSNEHANRFKLLIRKFAMQDEFLSSLYNHKKDDNFISKQMSSYKHYRYRFIIERTNIGIKLLRFYGQNMTYDTLNQMSSPINKVSGGKSKDKADIAIASNKKQSYLWQNKYYGKNTAQRTRVTGLPNLFILPTQTLSALSQQKNRESAISNTSREVLQNFAITDMKRLDQDLVQTIENYLESEYMPFYFHDLRTNEIISFNAFITNMSDSFTANYDSHGGFGRIEKVHTYKDTTRSISFDFIIAALSKEDHDLMWFQINKLVSMVYPQWSESYENITSQKGDVKFEKFKLPLTQTPTASPLIRIRIGDIIKSNYSRTNLARLHGLGQRKTKNANPQTPDKFLNIDKLISDFFKDYEILFTRENNFRSIFINKNIFLLKQGMYKVDETFLGNFYLNLNKTLYVKKISKNKYVPIESHEDLNLNETSVIYADEDSVSEIVEITPTLKFLKNQQKSLTDCFEKSLKEIKENIKTLEALSVNNITLFTSAEGNKLAELQKRGLEIQTLIKAANADVQNNLDLLDYKSFMEPYSDERTFDDISKKIINPITAGFESSMGRGLAGFIKSFSVDFSNEVVWETEEGSRAPIFTTVKVSFEPIHDIAPGLDSDGFMRAPVYNVGSIMNEIFGDVYDGNIINSGKEKILKMQKDIINASKNKKDFYVNSNKTDNIIKRSKE